MSKHGVVIQKVSCAFVVKCRKYLAENWRVDTDAPEVYSIMKTRSGVYMITDAKGRRFEISKFTQDTDGKESLSVLYRYNY